MQYNKLADKEVVQKTIEAMKTRNIEAFMVETGADALAKIKELIPAGASVMNGSSTTLEQVGFVDYLKSGTHGWNNLHEAILAETDPAKQGVLRKQAVLSDLILCHFHETQCDHSFRSR
ncbi:MAG: LUD domain-containing protein [Candidatus Magasanikbacteria bacterium]|nr:LUD domain-containing protein [Candidatus Magasanikbacteria bacterium]